MTSKRKPVTAEELLAMPDGNRYELIRGALVPKEPTGEPLMTADELLCLPRAEGTRYELIRGVLVEKMPTGDPHSAVVDRIHYLIAHHAEINDYGRAPTGEPGYRLGADPDTVRAPDVAWVAPGRIPEGTQGYPELAPDLAVEVKSPGNSNPELAAKAAMWLNYGSRMVWVADPDQSSITIYRTDAEPVTLYEDDQIDGADVLPGFTSPVWRLFRRQK